MTKERMLSFYINYNKGGCMDAYLTVSTPSTYLQKVLHCDE